MEGQPDVGKLKIMSIEREGTRNYEMQWTLSNYSKVEYGKRHTIHSLLVGNKVCHIKLLKLSKLLEDYDGEDEAYTEITLHFIPLHSALRSVDFIIVGANNLKYPPVKSRAFPRTKKEECYIQKPGLIVNDTLTVNVSLVFHVGKKEELSIFESMEKSNSHLGNLRQRELFTDAFVFVGQKQFLAHKTILSARSSVIRDGFERWPDWAEIVDIPDADYETVEEMLNYIYTGQTKNLNLDLASNLSQLANEYDLTGLKSKVATFLGDTMEINNVVKILLLADMHNHQNLKVEAMEFIKKNNNSVRRHVDWDLLGNRNDLVADITNHFLRFTVDDD